MSADHPEGWPPVPPEFRDALDTAKALQVDAAKAHADAYRPIAAEQQQAMQQVSRLQMAAIFMRDRLSLDDLRALGDEHPGCDETIRANRIEWASRGPRDLARGALRAADILIAESRKP